MKKNSKLSAHAIRLLTGVALGAMTTTGVAAQVSDQIVVTSQRTEQSLQDVPLAVTAFTGEALEDKQIEAFTDFQINTPNFSLSRTQFTSAAIVLRGIGALAVAADSEPALSIHMNDLPLSAPRIFETEFFDIERVEILRGPQGTLFGRNATGGVVNVITAKADPDGLTASAEAQYGNFNHVQVKGHLNVPLGENAAVRIAGLKLDRDGFSQNLFDGQDVDDRDVSAIRGSIRWYPTENTTLDIVASHFREDDRRLRSTKTLCTRDPSGVLGCLPSSLGFDTPNIASTLNLLSSTETLQTAAGAFAGALALQQAVLGGETDPGVLAGIEAGATAAGAAAAAPFGLFSIADQLDLTGPGNPADFRTINTPFTPQNKAEETIIMGTLTHDFEDFSVKLTGGWGRSQIDQQQQQNNLSGPTVGVPLAFQFGAPISYGALYGDGQFPISAFETSGFAGSIGGNTQGRTNTLAGIDYSTGNTSYYSAEAIVTTDFDGPLNFLAGGNINHSEGFANFYAAGPALDYTSVAGAFVLTNILTSGAAGDGLAFYGPNFFNDGNVSRDSLSAFGEVYWDITDTIKFTGGVRYNNDEKNVRDRALQPFGSLLCIIGSLSGTPCAISLADPFGVGGTPPFVVPLGTTNVEPFLDADPFTQEAIGTQAVSDFRVESETYEAVTGRAVLEWAATDETLVYASYSRGYKPGGFNPRAAVTSGVPLVYDSEFINAFEVGLKYTTGPFLANLSAFYYDYSGLQVSRIVNRTAINDNIDATIFGVEGEFVWNPTDALQFNATASYLNSDIGEFSAFDPGDPAASVAGTQNVELFKDLTTAVNCVVTRDAGDPALIGGAVSSPFTVCSALADSLGALNTGLGTNYQLLPGVEQSLAGNELPGAPDWQFSIGAQYEYNVSDNLVLTPRVDYYRQGDSWARPFNAPNDLIDGYDNMNVQVTLESVDGPWYVRGFLQNAFDGENITGSYLQDASSGLNYNVFLQEPRRYGIAVGARF